MKANRKILIPDSEPPRDEPTPMEKAIIVVALFVALGILVWAWGKGI